MLVIREETPRDVGQVRMINIAAFRFSTKGRHLGPHASLRSAWTSLMRHRSAG